MRIHRRNNPPVPAAGRPEATTHTPSWRLRWPNRYRRGPGNVRQAPESPVGGDRGARVQAAPGETMAAAMQLAIAVLTAGLDSPELEAWAAAALTPVDGDGLAEFMAGLHLISMVLLTELHRVTGESPAAILQRLAILAQRRRGTPLAD